MPLLTSSRVSTLDVPSPVVPGGQFEHERAKSEFGSVAVTFSPKSIPSSIVEALPNGDGVMIFGSALDCSSCRLFAFEEMLFWDAGCVPEAP